MACHVNFVPQSMATATAQPKAPQSSTLSARVPIQSPSSLRAPNGLVVRCAYESEPLRVMISGAPASGKGTQCELITQKYDLVHVAAGDLLRAEIASGSENGKLARKYMDQGQLVPDEIVVMMVKERLLMPDSREKGWLLDGYPRSSSQAIALKEFGFEPDLSFFWKFLKRFLDPRDCGKARLTQRFDDTEEKVKLRLHTHHQNVEAVLALYEHITLKVNGSVSKDDVFSQIDGVLAKLLEKKQATSDLWRLRRCR
ncbi:hypothetical protein M0R45_026751 [Rubus argutus]|uniref:adenylate kinase n=1 Tax=Rubus argutus TaxID=59490 RepID=A0AAW1X0A3_RUBAR